MSRRADAVLDLGTNSTRYLLVEHSNHEFGLERILDRGSVVTRLGQGIDDSGHLSQEAMDRVIDTVAQFDRVVRNQGGNWVDAIATHACRRADNGDELFTRVRSILGFRPRLISGDEEAELIARGVKASLQNPDPCMIVDIGGGSTEWICRDEDHTERNSFPIGVVTLRDRFEADHRWNEKDVEKMRDEVKKHLPDRFNRGDLIVVGGTGTTLSAYRQDLEIYRSEAVHADRLQLEQIHQIRDEFLRKTFEKLLREPMIQQGREDVMIPGIVILEEFARYADVDQVIVSDYGPLVGSLVEAMVHK